MEDKQKAEESYTAKDIFVLKGLEPVRKRPAMYIGSTGSEGLHHLIWECLDNGIDEAISGYAHNIRIELLKDGKIRVSDDGRGIPVDIHPQTKKSALETVMCTLHAGAKFSKKVYQISGGLHGVGVSVVNALSSYAKAEVCRDGQLYVQEYKKGKPLSQVKNVGKCQISGTKITFEPDSEIFKNREFNLKKIIDHVRQQAFLTPKVRFEIFDLRKEPFFYSFYFEGGIRSFLKYLIDENSSLQKNLFYVKGKNDDILVEAAFIYTQEIETNELGFVNNIYTPEGGTHITGFRSALTKVLNDWAREQKLLKEKDKNFNGDDVREGLTVVVSIKIPEPQFEGQTKAKLGNSEARTAVEKIVSENLKKFLQIHTEEGKRIIGKCLLASRAREAAKKAKETVLRKGFLEGLSLPSKLADCTSNKPEESELFIVEGESAGGSGKMARDRRTQAILSLKGKVINVEKSRIDKVLANQEIKSLILAIGTGIKDNFNLGKLRYNKIIILSDADVDGAHIRTLLLTLFYRYFKPVVENGHIYIACPPLYRMQTAKETIYAFTDKEKNDILKVKKGNVVIQRFKGLGEMNPEQLWETTMDPARRKLKQITVEEAAEADRLFDILMGEDVAPRKKFILTYATKVQNLDV